MRTLHRRLWAYLFIVISRLPPFCGSAAREAARLKEERLKRRDCGADSKLWTLALRSTVEGDRQTGAEVIVCVCVCFCVEMHRVRREETTNKGMGLSSWW